MSAGARQGIPPGASFDAPSPVVRAPTGTSLHILIVTPPGTGSRSGNQHTADRWRVLLTELGHAVRVEDNWAGGHADVLIALHALKSHSAIARFRQAHPQVPIVLALTGTDLYRDLALHPQARLSVQWAHRLVVLQEEGLHALPLAEAAKAQVLYQSVGPIARTERAPGFFDFAVIGHLREEKDPFRCFEALRLLPAERRLRLWQFGDALSDAMAARATALMNEDARYSWLGSRPHEEVLGRLAGMHAMVLSSRLEGGATVMSEALAAGVPVLASAIPGNLGMLGDTYPGYFPVENAPALARLIERTMHDGAFYQALEAGIAQRQWLVAVEREREGLANVLAAACVAAARPPLSRLDAERTDADDRRRAE